VSDLVLAPYAFQVVVGLLVVLLLVVAFLPINECDATDCKGRGRKRGEWCYWHHCPKSHCRSKGRW
jgi:hypothetical protein